MQKHESVYNGINLSTLIKSTASPEIMAEISKPAYDKDILVMQGHDGRLRFSKVKNEGNLSLDPDRKDWIVVDVSKGANLSCGNHVYPLVNDRQNYVFVSKEELVS